MRNLSWINSRVNNTMIIFYTENWFSEQNRYLFNYVIIII